MTVQSGVPLYRALSDLRHVPRFVRYPVSARQNVIEHSYCVAVLADEYAAQMAAQGHALDRATVLRWALWHDADEAVTGDIPHDVKRLSPELHAAFQVLGSEIRSQLGSLRVEGAVCPTGDGLEALAVKLADSVELLAYVETERQLGNHSMVVAADRIWDLLHGAPWARANLSGLGEWYLAFLRRLDEDLHTWRGGPWRS